MSAKNILVLSRMTEHCQQALDCGVNIAKQSKAQLYFMHVIHNPFSLEGWNIPVPSLEDEFKKLQNKAKAELDEIVESEKAKGLDIKELIEEGNPTEAVLKAVKDKNIDLLIMMGHQQGHFEDILFGETNEAITRRMPCSILLVKKQA